VESIEENVFSKPKSVFEKKNQRIVFKKLKETKPKKKKISGRCVAIPSPLLRSLPLLCWKVF
jgi:hypothetical protein